ncbi:hypothetical protein B0H17DRAFT_182311 [Mycena rosella]|uniref:Uncharacterized protein n=1 Tax=Mycena rosella TaxID=1033263 RepID=A0AAD7D1L1_MYCRO|nr:hypothetical protein B0H17DRAFT_182311 [Mycena rosella]
MQLAQIETLETEGDRAHDRIEQLIRKIHQIHPRLQQRLAFAVTKFPRNMATRNSANNDLLAMTIEASLVKVSLVRGQTHNTLYDYRFSKNPEFNMKRALVAAHAKLKEDERKMEEEEGALDRELADYQKLLDIVDGGGNVSFRQIIADSARVEKETEECRRDLRRLGWTGEN